jgi:hypothetical protein
MRTYAMASRITKRGFSHAAVVKIGEERYPCTVTNMSVTGATLHLDPLPPTVHLPKSFALQLTQDGQTTRACSLSWREGDDAGVLFIAP